jgi:hypothetical protein
MDSQLPADVDAPATSEVVKVSQGKRRWLIWVGILLAIFGVFVLSAPKMTGSRRKTFQTEAINNARQIGLALFEFETEYGEGPNEGTRAPVIANKPTDLHLGTKPSNDFFRQLIAAGIVSSETMFFAKIKGAIKPDNLMTACEVLKKGECGFSYLSGRTASGNALRPLLVTPLIPGTDRFDPKPFEGKALILKIDNSVTSLPIREDGHVWVSGMNLLDPHHPIWEGKPPVIAWPE